MREFEQKKIANPSSTPFFGPKIQKKLTTGTVGDKYETEADNVADKVVNKNKTGGFLQSRSEEAVQQKPISETISAVQKQDLTQEKPLQKKGTEKEEDKKVQKKSDKEEDKKVQKKGEKEEDKKVQKKSDKEEDKKVQKKEEKEEEKPVQKKCADCEKEDTVQKKDKEEEKAVQKKGLNSETEIQDNELEGKLDSSKGYGTGLDKKTKREMESGFGSDFSNVKIHTDANAIQMSQELGAQAFTNGNDVYFNQGKYNPESNEGKHLLAHELTHTVQQTGGTQKTGKIQKSSIENTQSEDLEAPRFQKEYRLEQAHDDLDYIGVGSKGASVQKLQSGLMDLGYQLPKFGADADFGSETKQAVLNFQSDNNLSYDGVVGVQTMGHLDDIYASKNKGKETPKPCKPSKLNKVPYSEEFTNQTKVGFNTTTECASVRVVINAEGITKDCTAFFISIDGKDGTKRTIEMKPDHTAERTFTFKLEKIGHHNLIFSMPDSCKGGVGLSSSVFKVSGSITRF
ncbi:eCIS core domain-containing protein [Flavobacterium sp. CF136]|uniref:eCIS core domain-containing protein n=1 Tax=Flavobacterium sp. (strain CF136) TaxID=1144313 RepID=UPI000271853C|nr:DUF4157 domain-containing protein [Flavobacterium sp. CF136]EJL64882.1 putative peptidoglycan-binding domain-containing protein [Flavobacterium sp. CF136]